MRAITGIKKGRTPSRKPILTASIKSRGTIGYIENFP